MLLAGDDAPIAGPLDKPVAGAEITQDLNLTNGLNTAGLTAGPTIGTQTAPEIARGGNSFLAVWQDLRTSPFVGPPFSTEGRGFDIYAQRLDAAGVPLDPAPFVITTRFSDQEQPEVAWNGQNWLVVWGGPNSTQWNHRIQAVRIAPDGTILDTTPITVATTMYESRFVLTANGTEWLVASQSTGAGEADIRAFRIGADGQLLNPGGTQLLPTSTSLFTINIASAQGEYLLVWGNSSAGPTGQRFTADLAPIGAPFPVNSFNVESNGTEYFVTWIVNSTYWDDFVYGQRLSVDGVPGPVLTLAGTGGGLPLWNPAHADISWDGSSWWVAWSELTRGVVFSRVTPADVVLDFGGVAVDPTAPDRAALEHAIAGGAAGGAQVVWSDARANGSTQRDIYSAAVSGDATPSPSGPIATSARAQLRLDFATGKDSANNEQALAIYLNEHSGDRKLVGQRLDSAGNPLDLEPFEIASGLDIETSHVGFDGTRYMVVWEVADQVYAKRILPTGVIVDSAPLLIMDGQFPAVAGAEGTFLVTATRQTIGPHFMHPFSMRVDGASGTNLDAAPVILGQYFARYPRPAWTGTRWLVTWQRNPTHDNPNNSVWASFVQPDGTTAGEFNVMTGGTPVLAISDDRALFVSRTNSPGSGANDIIGRLMFLDGTFVDTYFPIANGPLREFDPAVTWNGTEFVVAWTDKRSEVIYFDKRSEVFAARIEPDGTLIDSAGFAVGDTSDQEIIPAVTSIAGHTIVAASSFRDESQLQTYRLTSELLGGSPTGNRWPVAIASGSPASGDVPLMVNFSATGSFDPDGTVANYAWDFGDGGAGVGENPTHTYSVAGEYLAEVTVTDNQGASTRNTVRVLATPINQPPVAVASADPTSGHAPLSVVYQAAGSYDPDDGIAQIFWEFGDGGTYFGGTAYHTYAVPGTWVTTLTITDHSGASAVDTVTIEVAQPNQPPTTVATATPLTGTSPLSVSFDSSASSDTDGTITGYQWNFGDGNVSTEANPTHVYDAGGSYTAVLTVTDDDGGTNTDSVVIDVTQGDLTSLANADFVTEAGTITAGSYLDTHVNDGVYEELTEEQTNGKPAKRKSQLGHTWTFDVPAGPNHRFEVVAHHTVSGDDDDFAIEYSRDGAAYTRMLVVSQTGPSGSPQSYVFPEDVAGTLYIRAVDTDRTPGNSVIDTLYVDKMAVITSWQSGDTTLPAVPAGLAATAGDGIVSLDWSDNTDTDLAGYHVYRATTTGGPYTSLTAMPITMSGYTDLGVINGTTYYYVVTAVDTSNNESANSTEDTATPQAASTELTVTSIAPDVLAAGASTPATITGTGFAPGASVTFVNGNGPAPTASNVQVVNPIAITAVVTIGSGGPKTCRVWDVAIANPDGTTGTLTGGFTVDGGKCNLAAAASSTNADLAQVSLAILPTSASVTTDGDSGSDSRVDSAESSAGKTHAPPEPIYPSAVDSVMMDFEDAYPDVSEDQENLTALPPEALEEQLLDAFPGVP
jgi:PKD repeat protein